MSKDDKIASIQKDREEFERQRKELENDMSVGRNNMSKINKGLRNNVILEEPIVVDSSIGNHSSHSIHTHGKSGTERPSHPSSRASSNGEGYAGLNSPMNAGNSNSPMLAGVAANHSYSVGSNASNNNSNSNNNGILSTGANAGAGVSGNQLGIMPSGPRVSDWCYSASLDSPAPPAVKSREMYESVRLLGRGSFGEVNLVKNIEDNKLFAIKTQLCPKDSEFSNVLREVRFLRACRHPCIIDVHDAFLMTNPRIVYIVMHYCESGTVSSVISSARKNKATLAENQVLKWVLQLGLAMQFLHDNHVVHRNLKPMNVMLTEGGDSLKLADFGLAMAVTETEEDTNTDEAGTPYYTAPEMIQREPYSYPADCWSFGVIVHQLLALERPFDGNSTADLVKSILSADPPPLPVHYSEEIKLISAELLRKDQSERLTMTELLLEPIFHSKLSSFPQSYRPRTLEERIRRFHQKQLEVQIDALQRARKADGVRTVHEKVQQRQQAAEAAIAAAALAAEEAILAAATEVDLPGPLGGSSSGVGSPRLGLSRSASNTGTRSSTPSRTLAAATSGLRLSSADITVTQAQATVAAATTSSTAEPTSVSPTAAATTTVTTTAAVIASATAAGTVTTPDTPLLSQSSQTSLSTATTTAACTVDRAKSMSALGGGTEVVHDAIPEEGALDSCQNSVKICIIDDECLQSLPSLSVVVNNEETPLQKEAKTQTNVSKGLYSYGTSDLNASCAFLKTEPTSLSELVYDKSKQQMSPKKKNVLRSPVIDSGALQFPVQRPPPPQRMGPVSVACTQHALGSKSTGSLLGASNSFHSMGGMFYGSSSALLGSTSLASPSRPLLRPKLSAVNLLRDVGEKLDSDLRARAIMYEPVDERLGFATGGLSSVQGWREHQQRTSAPNTRPSSPGLQVVDVNQMVRLDAPPTPSGNQHQQDMTLHMKLAYLSIPTAGMDDQRTLSSKSRPVSRAAPRTPVSLSTQVLRLPSAGTQELSAHTELSGEMNSNSSAGSLQKTHTELGSLVDLRMGSEIETSIVSSALKTPPAVVLKKPAVTVRKTKVAATIARPPQEPTQIGTGSAPEIGGSAVDTGSPERAIAADASISPGLLQQLPAEQIQVLQQPHYRDPRFQNNPQEVVYRLRGHLLNTTPYPEEIAHLTLHGKAQPLPQYLRVQLEEQQQRYAHKVRVLGGQQGHTMSSIFTHSTVDRSSSAARNEHTGSPEPKPELDTTAAAAADGRASKPPAPVSPVLEEDALCTVEEQQQQQTQQQPDASEKSAPLRSPSLTQPPTSVAIPDDATSPTVAAAVAVAAAIAEAPGSSLPPSVGDASVLFSDDIESRTGTARSTLSNEHVAAQQQSEIVTLIAGAVAQGQPKDTAARRPTASTAAARLIMDDEESVNSFQESNQKASHPHAQAAQDDNHSIISAVSAASTARSHASSADGTNHRSLSIRISSTGNMYEVGGRSRSTRADSPLDPLIIRVGSHDLSEPDAAAAGGVTIPSGRSSPAAPVLGVPDFLQSSPAPQSRQHGLSTEGLVVQGRSSPGRRMSGQDSSRQRHSPHRVAYVLQDGSDRPQIAVLQALDQPSVAAGADDRSLHSLQSSVGNCSAITDDANMSMLSFTLPSSPLPEQSPLNSGKQRKHNLNGSSSLRTSSKYAPRLESILGGDSVTSAGPPAQPLPYQVHRKIMGWKLTSVQRRRNLVGILDLVHNSQQQQQRLQTQQEQAHRRSGSKSTLPGKLAPPKQIPHALLRMGHGKRVRSREIPPLPELTTQLASIQEQQQSLQRSQVSFGFERSAELQHWQQQMYLLQHTQNSSSNSHLNSNTAPLKSTLKSKKSIARNPLTASNSKLANLAIAVETMGKFLSEENEVTEINEGGHPDRIESETTT